MSEVTELIEMMRAVTIGRKVWDIMAPDGTDYICRFDLSDAGEQAALRYMRRQQAQGEMLGCFVREAISKSELHVLLEQAADQLERLQSRVDRLSGKTYAIELGLQRIVECIAEHHAAASLRAIVQMCHKRDALLSPTFASEVILQALEKSRVHEFEPSGDVLREPLGAAHLQHLKKIDLVCVLQFAVVYIIERRWMQPMQIKLIVRDCERELFGENT